MMYRQSLFARLHSSFGQQRKLFLLVFLWTCLCLLIFKSSIFNAGPLDQAAGGEPAAAHLPLALSLAGARQVAARSAATSGSVLPSPAAEPDLVALAHQTASQQAPGEPRSPPDEVQADEAEYDEPIAGSACPYDYPNLFDLQFNNIHWQRMSTKPRPASAGSNGSTSANYYLYNAYYDDRWRAGPPSVRILAMIDRVEPPPTNCLLWSSKLRATDKQSKRAKGKGHKDSRQSGRLVPIVSRANFVYAWYPKWGNYHDGLLQPWIVTCPMPRDHVGLVPDSVSLVEVPAELEPAGEEDAFAEDGRAKRETSQSSSSDQQQQQQQQQQSASIAMPPSFSSSSPSVSPQRDNQQKQSLYKLQSASQVQYDCKQTLPITNNLPVFNQRPSVKEKFAVCVKGLDFPHEDISVRLVEWIELLNLLGAGKIFLYNLDVHENTSKVLHYYQERGMVELSPLTLPGDQPNLPEYQHLYLKSKLTAKRQNELIPYNDCLYRNLNSYQYLALLDIDEIIMPLKHHNWYHLMQEVEELSLSERNYSRASYNVRNVYFFDDLAGPLGTTSSSSSRPSANNGSPSSASLAASADADPSSRPGADSSRSDAEPDAENQPAKQEASDSLELGIPHYLHMMQHVYRSKNYTKPGQYVKCFHNTERVVSLHNHFPMNCFGQCTTYSIPVHLAHLQHYRKDCVGPLKQSCKNDFRVFTMRDTTIWKYKQQMIRRTTRVLNHLNLLVF